MRGVRFEVRPSEVVERLYHAYNFDALRRPDLKGLLKSARRVSGWYVGRLALDCPSADQLASHLERRARCVPGAFGEAAASLARLLRALEREFSEHWAQAAGALEREAERLSSLADWGAVASAISEEVGRELPRSLVVVHPSLSVGSSNYSFTLGDRIVVVVHPEREGWGCALSVVHELLHSVLQCPDWCFYDDLLTELVEEAVRRSGAELPPGYPDPKLYFEENLAEALTLRVALRLRGELDLPSDIEEACADYWRRRGLALAEAIFRGLEELGPPEGEGLEWRLGRLLREWLR